MSLGNLIGIAFHVQSALGSMAIGTMWISPIPEHGISVHLFTSLCNFLLPCFVVLCVQVFPFVGEIYL